jgi:hypothetical protein
MAKWKMTLPALLLLISVWFGLPTAEASEMTAQEKFDELMEAGIFEASDYRPDENMERAEVARIMALLFKLGVNPEAASIYQDLEGAEWAAGFIGAATNAGILEGYGNGIYDPNGNITIEQLAKIFVLALDLEIPEESTVEGASDWAAGYIAAALNAGLIAPKNDYTVPATRNEFIEASYNVYEIEKNKAIGIRSAEPVGTSRVHIGFTDTVDPSAAAIAIVRIGEGDERIPVSIDALEWSDDGREVTATLTDAAEPGTYEVTLSGIDSLDADNAARRYQVEPEQLKQIRLGGADPLPYADNVEVPYFLINQYGEPMKHPSTKMAVTTNKKVRAELLPDRKVIRLHLKSSELTPGNSTLKIQLFDFVSKLSVSATYQIGAEPYIRSIEPQGFVDEAGRPIDALQEGESAFLSLRLYDQYGNAVTNLQWLNESGGIGAASNSVSLTVSEQATLDPNGGIAFRVKAGAVHGEQSAAVTVSSPSHQVSAQASITLKARPIEVPTVAPPASPAPQPNPDPDPGPQPEPEPGPGPNPDPDPEPLPSISVDPDSIVILSDETRVTVTSTNATELYYALLPSEETEIPTVDQLLQVEEAPPSSAYDSGRVTTDGVRQLALKTRKDQPYKLYIVGKNSSSVSDLLVVDFYTDSANVFELLSIIDLSTPDELWICLMYTPPTATGTVYYAVSDQPLIEVNHPDVLVQLVLDHSQDERILYSGSVPWNGSADQFNPGPNDGQQNHIYVVLEYKGVRMMFIDILNQVH